MKKLLSLVIYCSIVATCWADTNPVPKLTEQAEKACLRGQEESYKLIPLDTNANWVSPEVWEAYNYVVAEHKEKQDIIYPQQGSQQQPLSCHQLLQQRIAEMDIDYQ